MKPRKLNFTPNLYDITPKRDWHRLHIFYMIIWVMIWSGIIGGLIWNLIQQPSLLLWILMSLMLLLLVMSFWINFDMNLGLINTLWDDMDYQDVTKKSFTFTTTDGSLHYGYLYYPKDLNFHLEMPPQKTLIGFHGWGSHHREMDRYCLPTVIHQNFLYFTMDASGSGNTSGNKNDFHQFEHAKEFLDLILEQSYVDPAHVAVVGMSMGAAKAGMWAYPHPNVRAVVMLSGPYDLEYTKRAMTLRERIIFKIFGFKFHATPKQLHEYSAIYQFKADGIRFIPQDRLISNGERVLLLANQDDPTVKVENTYRAIEKLNLPEKNYKIYNQGLHGFRGNEYYVAVEIYEFLKEKFN